MRKNEIQKCAEIFCKEHHITEYPVEIIRICKECGLKVFEEYLDKNLSGLIVVDNKDWKKYGSSRFIVVNLADSAERRRFTIAHELAHFILHKGDSALYAHRDVINNSTAQNIEREANYFAANILMPEQLVREKVEDIKRKTRKPLKIVLIKEISDCFVVSAAAAEIRLSQLNII